MNRTCNMDDCDRKHMARGLCGSHYNKIYCPDRHPKKTVPCIVCGKVVTRSGGGGRKIGHTCSNECRRILTFGDRCELPADHWARMYGATCIWKPPAPTRASFQCGACRECGIPITESTGQTSSDYCSHQCAKRVSRRRRRAREHDAPGEYRWVDVMRQYRKQGYVCAYCMQPCTGLPDPEHVMPLSRGGRNDMSNLVAACRACNADKNDLTLEEWKHDRLRRGLTPVRTTLTGLAYKHLMPTQPTRPAWRHQVA